LKYTLIFRYGLKIAIFEKIIPIYIKKLMDKTVSLLKYNAE
jgi:hypothetical protein